MSTRRRHARLRRISESSALAATGSPLRIHSATTAPAAAAARMQRRHRSRDHGIPAKTRLLWRAVEPISRRSMPSWSIASHAAKRVGDLARHAAIARTTSRPPNPHRRLESTASPVPVDAPAGAIARPVAPFASTTSASTVGRPRESQTRRPMTRSIAHRLPATDDGRWTMDDGRSPSEPRLSSVLRVSSAAIVQLARALQRARGPSPARWSGIRLATCRRSLASSSPGKSVAARHSARKEVPNQRSRYASSQRVKRLQ